MSGSAVVCPACGSELLPHQTRVTCRHCGYRYPTEASVCPKCGKAPTALLPVIRTAALRIAAGLWILLLLACMGWLVFRLFATNTIPRLLGLSQPVRSPTPEVVYVVATQPLPLPTLLLPPTVEPTALPSPTSTRVGAATPSPTRRGALTPTVPPITTLILELPSPTPASYPAPQLIGPANMATFRGADAKIILEWQPVTTTGLSESEWYMISIKYTGRNGSPIEQAGWSREPRWAISKEWWNDAAPNARTFQWQVTTTRIDGIDPFASPVRIPISPSSPVRSFIWN